MVESIQLFKTDELKEGEMRKIDVGDLNILIIRIGDEFFAVNNKCPHMGGDLSQGTLDGTIITCPVHHSQFDVTTGQVIRWTDFTGFKASVSKLFKSPKPLTRYELIIEDSQILLKMETP
jgi:3-phenylpropionate/trans-cinnamate dioxygenase ferredoxin component